VEGVAFGAKKGDMKSQPGRGQDRHGRLESRAGAWLWGAQKFGRDGLL